MSGGSHNLRRYVALRRAGETREVACERSGVMLAEATLWDADEAKGELGWVAPAPANDPEAAGCAVTTVGGIDMPRHDDTDVPETDDPLIELADATLRGDVRDSLLSWFKAQPKSWPFMAEREQRDLADAADRFAGSLVKQACQIIAAGERPCIVATLTEYREKDGVEAKLKLPSKGEVVAALHEACGREVLIVTSGAEEYLGEQSPAKIDADQPKLNGIGDEYDEAA